MLQHSTIKSLLALRLEGNSGIWSPNMPPAIHKNAGETGGHCVYAGGKGSKQRQHGHQRKMAKTLNKPPIIQNFKIGGRFACLPAAPGARAAR